MRAQFRGNGTGGGPFAPWSEQSERLREADAQFNSITGGRDLLKRNMTIWIAASIARWSWPTPSRLRRAEPWLRGGRDIQIWIGGGRCAGYGTTPPPKADQPAGRCV